MTLMITYPFRRNFALIAVSASLALLVSGCGNMAGVSDGKAPSADSSIIDVPNLGSPGSGSSSAGGASDYASCPEAPLNINSQTKETEATKGVEAELSDNDKYAASLLGYEETDGESCALEAGFTWRIISRDGETFPVTKDYRFDRINAGIENGLVTFSSIG